MSEQQPNEQDLLVLPWLECHPSRAHRSAGDPRRRPCSQSHRLEGPGRRHISQHPGRGVLRHHLGGDDHALVDPVILDGAAARSAYPLYERVALRLLGIDEFVWLRKAH